VGCARAYTRVHAHMNTCSHARARAHTQALGFEAGSLSPPHRLDAGTQGCVVLSRTPDFSRYFQVCARACKPGLASHLHVQPMRECQEYMLRACGWWVPVQQKVQLVPPLAAQNMHQCCAGCLAGAHAWPENSAAHWDLQNKHAAPALPAVHVHIPWLCALLRRCSMLRLCSRRS